MRKNFPSSAPPSSGFLPHPEGPPEENVFLPAAADRKDPILFFRPLIPLLIAFAAGIAANPHFPGYIPAAIILVVFSSALVLSAALARRSLPLFPLVLFFALGYLSLSPWTAPPQSERHVRHYLDGDAWKITGTIGTPVADQGFRAQFILNDLAVAPPSAESESIAVSGSVRCLVYGNPSHLKTADRIEFVSKVHSFSNFNNPGGFDYRQYMNFQGISGNTYAASGKVSVINRHCSSIFRAWLQNYRTRIAGLIHQAGTDPSRQVLAALLTGNREEIAPEVRNAFNRAGVSHLLAISGLHIGIVASGAFFISRLILSFFPLLLRRAWVSKGAALAAILPVVLYGMLSGMSPSTQRAVLMISAFLATFLVQREHDLFNTLALAALIILIIDPPALFSISFQLSFMAVISILICLPAIEAQRAVPAGFLQSARHAVYMFMCISFFATLGTAPLVMTYFNQISLVGIFANVILIPLIGYLVVPIGLVSILLFYPVWEPAARWGLHMDDHLLSFSLRIIDFFSGLGFAAFKTITPSWMEIAIIYGMAGLLIWRYQEFTHDGKGGHLQDSNAGPSPDGGKMSRTRRRQTVNAALVILFLILMIDIGYWVNRRFFDSALRVTIMDVGQGNAAVLQLPGGKCALIDGGGLSGNEVFDMGARILAPFLWQNKIARVDTVFLTHPDADHLNGLIFICENFGVRQVISTHQGSDSREYRRMLDIIQSQKIAHPAFEAVAGSFDIGGITFDILHPRPDFAKDVSDPGALDTNNHSLVIRIGYCGRHILFPGDIYASGEAQVISACGGSLSADILVVPHHGSKTSCSSAFIRAVDPRIAVLSLGRNNRFGFPDPGVIKRLCDYGCELFQTQNQGAVRIIVDENETAIIPVIGNPIFL